MAAPSSGAASGPRRRAHAAAGTAEPALRLIDAAKRGDADAVRELASGLSPSERAEAAAATDEHKRTALHHAVVRSHRDAVIALLECGLGSVDATDVGGFTPLHMCSSARVTRVLLQHRADPCARNRAMRTPREHAAFLSVSDSELGPLLLEAERAAAGGVLQHPKLLTWKSIALAAVLAAIITRYLTMAVEGELPLRTL